MTTEEAARLQARDIVTGWILTLWALTLGTYLTMGGAKHLTSPAYSILMRMIHGHYEWVGITLAVFGALSCVAMLSKQRTFIAVAAFACGMWCAGIAFCMGVAMLTIPGAGNMNTFTSGLGALLFFVRALDYGRPTAGERPHTIL